VEDHWSSGVDRGGGVQRSADVWVFQGISVCYTSNIVLTQRAVPSFHLLLVGTTDYNTPGHGSSQATYEMPMCKTDITYETGPEHNTGRRSTTSGGLKDVERCVWVDEADK